MLAFQTVVSLLLKMHDEVVKLHVASTCMTHSDELGGPGGPISHAGSHAKEKVGGLSMFDD